MVKSIARNTLVRIGTRSIVGTWAIALGRYIVTSFGDIPFKLRESTSYTQASFALGSAPHVTLVNDLPLNFFLRAALEGGYDYIIELGSHTADRARRLATLLPSIRPIYALDITPDFATEQNDQSAVIIGPNNLKMIGDIVNRHSGRGLVCVASTLSYYPPDDLKLLLATLKTLRLHIALVEPNIALGENWRLESFRRSGISWYHPYRALLRVNGFSMQDADGAQIARSWSPYGEEYTFILANPQ